MIAQASNVKDCLENDQDCSELNEELRVDIESTDEVEDNQQGGQSLVSVLFKMFFALLVVLGLIYVTLRFLNKRHKMFQQVQALENLGGLSVGQNKSIQVVRVGSKMYLLGVGENVELLKEIVDEDVKHDLLHKNVDQPLSASEWITSLLQPKEKKNNNEEVAGKFKQMFSTELDKLQQHRKEMIDYHKQKEDPNE